MLILFINACFLFGFFPAQILEEDGSLVEIGPRFVLNLVRIFKGSIGGQTLYENSNYVSPNEVRTHFGIKTSKLGI